MSTSAAIIAGGASRRMGRDKAELNVAGGTLLTRTVALASGQDLAVTVVGRTRPDGWSGPSCAFVIDREPGSGPLGGIASAFAATSSAALLVLPCDLPALTPAALAWLLDRWRADGRVHGTVALRDGRLEPLFAVYDRRLAPMLDAAIASGERSCWRALAAADLDRVEVPAAHHAALRDCDTPEEWAELKPG